MDAGHLYWTNINGNTIGRANLDGTSVNQNFITGAHTPLGVAVPAVSYAVAYDGNSADGGSAPSDGSSPYTSGTTVTVLGPGGLTKTGYSFTGWNTAADGSGIAYAQGDSFSMPASDLILYAQWAVTPPCDPPPSGVVGWWPGSGNANDLVGINPGTLVNGATFAAGQVGQAFSFDGVDDFFQSGTTGLPIGTSDRTLEFWARISSVVAPEAFFAGYGSFGSFTQTYQVGASGSAPFFSQWGGGVSAPSVQTGTWHHMAVTNVGAVVRFYIDGALVGSDSLPLNTPAGTQFYMGRIPGSLGDPRKLKGMVDEVTIYDRALSGSEIQAIFQAGSAGKCTLAYPVIYDGNSADGGSVPTDGSNPHDYGTTVTVLGADSLTKTGYSFTGWSTAADGSGTDYSPSDTFSMPTANVTLYAQWQINAYAVAYDGNGATGGSVPSDGSSPYPYGSTVTVLHAGSMTRRGYSFAGWNSQPDGFGFFVYPGETFSMPASDVTLYAQWRINSHAVVYDGNGATRGSVPSDGSSPHDYGTTVTVLGAGGLTRTGYTFDGWNTAANGSGVSYQPGGTFAMPDSAVTLYARWATNLREETTRCNGTYAGDGRGCRRSRGCDLHARPGHARDSERCRRGRWLLGH